jgi:hypothetical protein
MTSGRLVLATNFNFTGKNPPLSTLASLQQLATAQRILQNVFTLSFGTGSGQCNTIIANAYELAATASNTHNFFDGSVPDIFGDANGLQNLKALMIYLVANVAAVDLPSPSITIGNAAADPLLLNLAGTTPTYQHFASSLPFLAGKAAGYTVNNTNKNIKVLNDSATLKATYWVLGAGVKV